jgi:DNA segregation ATPase FtsK/SpoIIIE-like protein
MNALPEIAELTDLRRAAIALVQRGRGEVSTSLIQRTLGIGYNKAARLIENLLAAIEKEIKP